MSAMSQSVIVKKSRRPKTFFLCVLLGITLVAVAWILIVGAQVLALVGAVPEGTSGVTSFFSRTFDQVNKTTDSLSLYKQQIRESFQHE